MTGSVRKAQELIAELGSCFPLQWRFFSSVALQQQPVACLEVPAQKSRRAVPAAFALPLQQGRAREGAQGRRRRAAGAGRCPPPPPPPVPAGLQLRAGAGRAPGAGSEADGDGTPAPVKGGLPVEELVLPRRGWPRRGRWQPRQQRSGRPGCGGPEGEGDRGPSNGPAGPGESPEEGGSAWEGAGRLCVGGTGRRRGGAAPCRNRRRGLPGAGAAGRWERGAAASSKGKELPRSCCLPCCRLPRPSSLLSAGQKAGDGRDPFSPPFGGGTRFASRYPHLLVSAQPARKDQAAARFAPTGWGGEEKREEKARGSRRGRGGSLTSYGGRQKRD